MGFSDVHHLFMWLNMRQNKLTNNIGREWGFTGMFFLQNISLVFTFEIMKKERN